MRPNLSRSFTRTLQGGIAALSLMLAIAAAPAHAAGGNTKAITDQKWSFQGIFGKFDRGALRRGTQVYLEVCANCHSLNLVSYRNLTEIGFSEDEVKEIASEYEVLDGPNDVGDMYTRQAKLSDRFVSPYANEQASRASNGGAYPPDLSVITKARKNGVNYLYAMLTGFHEEAPAGFELSDGMYYNDYFPGHQIAMAPPLEDETVEYEDGTPATLAQQAHDITTFLAWAAEPELEERKSLGIKVMLYLFLLTAMLYALKVKIWNRICLDGSDQENPPA